MKTTDTDLGSRPIAVIDDDDEIRDTLHLILSLQGYQVECFSNGHDFFDNYHPEKFICVVLDICLPKMSGIEIFEAMRNDRYFPPVIFFSGYGDISTAISMMKRGATNYVEKPSIDKMLIERIEESISIGNELLKQWKLIEKMERHASSLTVREKEVMELVLQGKMNKQIAHELGISIKTVETHRAKLLEKMNVRSAIELARLMKDRV